MNLTRIKNPLLRRLHLIWIVPIWFPFAIIAEAAIKAWEVASYMPGLVRELWVGRT